MKIFRQFIPLFVFLLLFAPTRVLSQKGFVVFVHDENSGIPVENANIKNLTTGVTLLTDGSGYCRMTVSDKDRMLISHVSYRDTTIEIRSTGTPINVGLLPLELSVIEVYAGEPFNKKAAQGANQVSLPFLTATPSFLGEPDIIKGLTFLPGVSEGKEGYSHLFVRGGDQDQNQILLDGATLFNVNHFGGYISMFQPELVGGVDFYKNYWPSRFGGRLSSVLDIRTKEGNYKEHHQSFQFGLIAPKVSASGPIVKNKLSYQVGMRRTIVDLATGSIARKIRSSQHTGDIGNLITGDITVRLDGRISNNQHISLTGLYGRDKHSFLENYPQYNQLSDDSYGIKNELLALNYKINLGLSTSLRAHTSYTSYRHFYENYVKGEDGQKYGTVATNIMESSRLSGNSVRSIKYSIQGKTQFGNLLDINYAVEREDLNFGIYLNRKEMVNGSTTNEFNGAIGMSNVVNTAFSTDISYRLSDRFNVSTGARVSKYTIDRNNSILLEPKMLLTYELNGKSTVNAAFNMQRQSSMLLGFTDDIGRFREFYITNDGQSPIASSKQWSLGYFRNALGLLDNVSVELFFKQQANTVKYVPSVDFDKDVLLYKDFLHRNGKGRTYGLELLLQKTTGKVHSSLSYTYANSQSKFPTLNSAKWFNADFDFRHSVNFLMMYSFGNGYRLSGNWTYKTGRPFTVPSSRGEIEDWRTRFNIMDDLNNMRMPAFHRLDVNIERRWKTKRGNTNWFGVGVYNVYNRVNPFFAQPADTPGKLEVTGMFPIMPFFNIGFEL